MGVTARMSIARFIMARTTLIANTPRCQTPYVVLSPFEPLSYTHLKKGKAHDQSCSSMLLG